MLVFPTLTKRPSYGFSDDSQDNTVVSKSDGGYKSTRPRNTRLVGIWVVPYEKLSDAEYQSLMSFWRTQTYGCAEMFQWTHPKFGTTHTVRFTAKPAFTVNEYGWNGQYTVEEV